MKSWSHFTEQFIVCWEESKLTKSVNILDEQRVLKENGVDISLEELREMYEGLNNVRTQR